MNVLESSNYVFAGLGMQLYEAAEMERDAVDDKAPRPEDSTILDRFSARHADVSVVIPAVVDLFAGFLGQDNESHVTLFWLIPSTIFGGRVYSARLGLIPSLLAVEKSSYSLMASPSLAATSNSNSAPVDCIQSCSSTMTSQVTRT